MLDLSEIHKISHSGDKFLFQDSGKSSDRTFGLANLPALDILYQSDVWHCDRMILLHQMFLYQAYQIRGLIESNLIALVFGFRSNKAHISYERFFCYFDQLGPIIVIDLMPLSATLLKMCNLYFKFIFFHL